MALKRPSPRVQLVIGFMISALFLALAVKDVDGAGFLEAMKKAELSWSLPLMLLLLVAAYGVRALRWALILRPVGRFSTREVTPAMMVGFMGNNIYPAHLGEFLRAYAFARQKQLPFSTVFSTLVVERVFDLLAILSYFYAAVLLLEQSAIPAIIRQAALLMALVTGGVILAIVPFVICYERAYRVARWSVSFLPDRFGNFILSIIEAGSQGLGVARSPGLMLSCLATSYLHWLLFGLMTILAINAFGVEVTLAQALFLQGVTAMAVVIPASPGFVGIVQAAFTLTLPIFGVHENIAFAASWYYHIVQYVPVTLAGLYFLKILGVDVKQAQAARAQGKENVIAEPSEQDEECIEHRIAT